jgi:5'-3' exonuclease
VAYDRRKQMLIDEPAVVAKFGVSPRSIPDYLALVGDSADGFPGLPGWGAKSSATLLARYGSLERIPLDASLWDVNVRGGDKLAATMREHMASALLFRFLASLRRDVPLQEDLGDLEWRGVRAADYRALCAELGFNDLAQRPQHWLE